MQIVRNNKKFVFPFIPLLLTFLVLVGCTVSIPPATPAGGTAIPEPEQGLADTNWQLIALGDAGAATPVLTGSTVTLAFSTTGQAGGNGGCNSYGGDYMVEGDTLAFGEIVSTLMACADQNVTEQEQQYLAALSAANRFAISADTLTIWFDDGAGELNFVATSPVVTPTSVVTATLPAPATPLPTASEGSSEATRITFDPGAISAEIQGNLAERATDFYVLAAQQGQIMSVEITSPNNDVRLSVIGQDGTPLKRYQNGPPSWTSTLPATQDYFIHAVSVGPTSDYTLRVWVEPLGDSGAERIEFASGETSASRSGALPEGGVKEYILTANAGQTMQVQTVGYNAPVSFTIRSPGGGTWNGEAQGSEVYIFTAQVVLPEAGDYVVTLSLPADAGATRYDVTFTIDAGAVATTPVPSEAPEWVEFAAGATMADRGGLLPSGPGIKQYMLTATEGQTMTVDATSDGTPLSMTIEGPSSNRWIPEMRRVDEGYAIGQQFTLPETGDYVVTLGKDDHSPSTNYTIMFTIQ